MKATVSKTFTFEAAHRLPNHPGKCRFLHGHSYKVVVTVEGEIDPATGMVIDFDEISQAWKERCHPVLDHKFLNDLIDNPTAERLALWLFETLKGLLPGLVGIKVYETPNSYAEIVDERSPSD